MDVMQLDDSVLAAFERDGFATIEHLVSPVEVASLYSTLMALHETNIGYNEGAQFDAVSIEDTTEQRRFPQIINPRIYAPALKNSAFYTAARSIARQLLGPRVRFKADISLLKPAVIGSPTPWHQDEAFGNPAFDYDEVSIWLALTPANATNSCMSFLPGSHNFPVLEHRPMNGDPRIHSLECIGQFNEAAKVECPLSPGGCTIHHHRTLHCAGPNTSPYPRLAYVLIFDTIPTLRTEPRGFPWHKDHNTARARREYRWRRNGGILIHAWRQRNRIRLTRIVADLRRARVALVHLLSSAAPR